MNSSLQSRPSPIRFPFALPFLGLILALASLPWGTASAAKLREARVTQVIKDVKLLPKAAAPRPAAVSDPVGEDTAV
ncbi:MAG: hypothetical protein M3429_05195, partial [Verrucomicrobiota bacterium]|nr:hypothetical protein [Verrucomicrobiota bacterium]